MELKSTIILNHFFETIIWRAFQNSCNQMNYTLENCLNELKLLLKNLRELAKGKQTKFSYFMGLSWIYLEKNIEMEDMLIHPLDSTDNPGLYTSFIANHGKSKLLGAIACIKVPIKVVGKGEKGISQTVHPDKEISQFIKKINLSLFFSLKDKNSGITLTFAESGFVLERPGSYCSNSSTFRSFNILENNNFDTFSSWLKKIDSSIGSFQTVFDRLCLILSERRDPIDAIIDGVIAWEALFGEERDTSFKVCGSILKLLKPENKIQFYKQLTDVYSKRSRIVHGSNSDPVDSLSEAEKIKNFVCDVARNCLVKLIDEHKDLISLNSKERCKKILLDM